MLLSSVSPPIETRRDMIRNEGSFQLSVFLILSALLLAGCTGSRPPVTARYQSAANETIYRARSIGLGTLFESGGLGQDPRVSLRGWATCSGENCHPREAWLSFSLQRSAKEMQLVSDRSVRIETAQDAYTWNQKNVPGSRAPTSGEIVRVSLDMATLEDIATTKRFQGTIGGEGFKLSYEEREPLRALYEKASGKTLAARR